jgi:hypothetical protein
MSITQRMAHYGGLRLSRRLSRSVPFIGTAVALLTLGAAVRRKGFFRGALDTALNATPFVGTTKLALETVRGRDLLSAASPRARSRMTASDTPAAERQGTRA